MIGLEKAGTHAKSTRLQVCTAGPIYPSTQLESIKAGSWTAVEFGRYGWNFCSGLSDIRFEFEGRAILDQIS